MRCDTVEIARENHILDLLERAHHYAEIDKTPHASRRIATTRAALGDCYLHMGCSARAIEYLHASLQTPGSHVVLAMTNMMQAYIMLGNAAAALAAADVLIHLYPNRAKSWISHVQACLALMPRDRVYGSRALEAAQRACHLAECYGGANSALFAQSLRMLSRVYRAQGNENMSLKIQARVVAMRYPYTAYEGWGFHVNTDLKIPYIFHQLERILDRGWFPALMGVAWIRVDCWVMVLWNPTLDPTSEQLCQLRHLISDAGLIVKCDMKCATLCSLMDHVEFYDNQNQVRYRIECGTVVEASTPRDVHRPRPPKTMPAKVSRGLPDPDTLLVYNHDRTIRTRMPPSDLDNIMPGLVCMGHIKTPRSHMFRDVIMVMATRSSDGNNYDRSCRSCPLFSVINRPKPVAVVYGVYVGAVLLVDPTMAIYLYTRLPSTCSDGRIPIARLDRAGHGEKPADRCGSCWGRLPWVRYQCLFVLCSVTFIIFIGVVCIVLSMHDVRRLDLCSLRNSENTIASIWPDG